MASVREAGQDTKVVKGKGGVVRKNTEDKSLPKKATRCYEDNPAKGEDVGRGTRPTGG